MWTPRKWNWVLLPAVYLTQNGRQYMIAKWTVKWMHVRKWAWWLTPIHILLLRSICPSKREIMFLCSSEEQRSAGQRKSSEEGIMGRNRYYELEDQEGFEHGVSWKHKWNVDVQSQSTRISGKGKSISNYTQPLAYCFNYGLLSWTPTSAKYEESKNEQLPTLRMLKASSSEL